MSSSHKNLSEVEANNLDKLTNVNIGVITAEWNNEITYALRDACIQTLKEHGCTDKDIISAQVPGAFELPSGAKFLLANHKFDAIICIGCVIKGETKHDEYICNAVAGGIMTLAVSSGIPIVFGVLTPNDQQQALDRAGGKYGNKGVEAAMTAIKMINLAKNSRSLNKKKIGF